VTLERVLVVDPIDGEYVADLEVDPPYVVGIKKRGISNFLAIAMPGFVDPHVHGCFGLSVMDGEFSRIEERLYSCGVTGFLATTISSPMDELVGLLEKVKGYRGLSFLGIHLEGPYISKERAGAHPREFVRKPSEEEIEILKKYPEIKLVTFAPEQEGSHLLFDLRGVTLSAGHSNATFSDFLHSGLKRITHFPNALRPLHHREVGAVGAGLLLEDVDLELICDGVHVCGEMVKLIYKMKGAHRIVLVTDAIPTTGLKDGRYSFAGVTVLVEEGISRTPEGNLAGGACLFPEVLKKFEKFTGATLRELAAASSYNACRELGLKDMGRIKEGTPADVVILDEDLNVKMTLKNGLIMYKKL